MSDEQRQPLADANCRGVEGGEREHGGCKERVRESWLVVKDWEEGEEAERGF